MNVSPLRKHQAIHWVLSPRVCLRAVCFRSDWGKRDKFSSPLASKLINWLNFYVPLCHDQWMGFYCPGGLNRVSILLLNGTNIEILHCIAWNPTKSILRFVVLVLCHPPPLRQIELRGQFRGAYTQRLLTHSVYCMIFNPVSGGWMVVVLTFNTHLIVLCQPLQLWLFSRRRRAISQRHFSRQPRK